MQWTTVDIIKHITSEIALFIILRISKGRCRTSDVTLRQNACFLSKREIQIKMLYYSLHEISVDTAPPKKTKTFVQAKS